MRTVTTIAENNVTIVVTEQNDLSVTYRAGATIDGDGANGQSGGNPCYAPASYAGATLDVLGNAGRPGKWWGVVTDDGTSSGDPIIQEAGDPCRGAYVSSTSLVLPEADGSTRMDSDPFKYVDSSSVPFIVVPPSIISGVAGIVMGCQARVTYKGNTVAAVVADEGPPGHIGEISVACAVALGIPLGAPYQANGGGAAYPTVSYQLFPGTAAVVNGITYPLQSST